MILYISDYTQKEDNTLYPHPTKISGPEDLRRAVMRDHIAPKMKDWYRHKDNFLQANCIMLDLDNTHSEDPAEWKTVDDVADAFPDVPFYYVQSRNYMRVKTHTAKDGTITYYEAREKYHFYFPLQREYTNHDQYKRLMLTAAGLYPYFDMGAAKPAQFFFGVKNPVVGKMEGSLFLDQFLEQQPPEAIVKSVKAFTDKMRQGIYKSDGETAKAANQLLRYFGIEAQQNTPEAPSDSNATLSGEAEKYSEIGREIAKAEQQKSENWFLNFAQQHNIELGTRYSFHTREHPDAVCYCVTCPWEKDHTMNGSENEAVVIVDLGGKLNFLCRHSHGYMYSWKDYRAYYEKRDTINPSYSPGQAAQSGGNGADDKNPVEGINGTGTAPETPARGLSAQEEAGAGEPLPGLLTYTDAVNIFETADDRIIELKSFPAFSKTAKIKAHDSVVIAADTGGGKSSLALNFLNDLNDNYPCVYINLEMDTITVLRRLTAIHSGLELDRIEGYKNDEKTAAAVNISLQAITSRKPLQVIQGAYILQDIENIIKMSVKGREEPTVVFIDHSLLVDTQERTGSRYDRFTQVSEGLRKMALGNNIILFVLLQQNRAGKSIEDEKPRNSSLKESGSWENDATHICFLWYDPTDRKKKLLLTKNRGGGNGEFTLNYWKKTQTYTEAAGDDGNAQTSGDAAPRKESRRDRQRKKLVTSYETAYFKTFGKPTIQDIAEAADVTTGTVKTWLKEYGGFMVDGKPIDPAGFDTVVEQQDFIKLTPTDSTPFDDETPASRAGGKI